MKRIFAILSILSVFASFGASASTTILSCNNGNIDEVGDGYFQIDILEDGITFLPYEGQFTIEASGSTHTEGTFSIVNQTVTESVEGEEQEVVVNALLILDEKEKTLNVAFSRDRGPFQNYEMTCVSQQN